MFINIWVPRLRSTDWKSSLNKFVELLNGIYIAAQNSFLAALDEVTQVLVIVCN